MNKDKDLKIQSDEIIRLKAELKRVTKKASILEQDVYEISKVAIKIVAYFNQDETVWDSKMYEQKHVVIELLNQLNQNKED